MNTRALLGLQVKSCICLGRIDDAGNCNLLPVFPGGILGFEQLIGLFAALTVVAAAQGDHDDNHREKSHEFHTLREISEGELNVKVRYLVRPTKTIAL